MYGAILGDMIGAPYEYDRGSKTKEFPMFTEKSHFTDDSVMTLALAEALLDSMGGTEVQVKVRLPEDLRAVLERFDEARGRTIDACASGKEGWHGTQKRNETSDSQSVSGLPV